MVPNEDMCEALLNRGVFVDLDELKPTSHSYDSAWRRWRGDSSSAVGRPCRPAWSCVAARAGRDPLPAARQGMRASQILQWAERYPDHRSFVVMRHDHSRHEVCWPVHLLHAASWPCWCAGWSGSIERQRIAVGAALTMNLPIIDPQGGWPRAVASWRRSTAPDRRASDRIRRAAACRRPLGAGVAGRRGPAPRGDRRWRLPEQAVQQPTELAQMLHLVDVFLPSTPAGGGPIRRHPAARDIYTGSKGHPIAGLIVKEFGPSPGTLVGVLRRNCRGCAPRQQRQCAAGGLGHQPSGRPARRRCAATPRWPTSTSSVWPPPSTCASLMPHQLYDLRF